MKIFINQDSKKFVSSQKFNAVVNRFDFKRGDTAKIELAYVQNNELIQLAGAYTIVFGIKEAGKYDGDYVVYEAVFVYNATTGFYEGEPNFNTTELNDLLNADDGDDTNDIPYVDCLFEITATDEDGISSSATSTARVFHDVNKGNEGIPTGANPSYSVVGHVHSDYAASIAAIEARDWVALSNNVYDYTVGPSVYPIGTEYVMGVTTSLGYPCANGVLITEARRADNDNYIVQTLNCISGGDLIIHTRKGLLAGDTWTAWQKVITSEAGVIADDLEFSSTTLTAPNLVSTAPDSLVTRSDLGLNTILVQTAADLSGVLDSTKVYKLDGIIDMGSQSITVPTTGLSIIGDTFDVSGLVSSEDAYTMFVSESIAIGSGNLLMKDLKITTDGAGSKVYELYDATGFNAFELLRVNYIDCTSLGDIYEYRQGLEDGTGRLGGSPSLTLHGIWLGGFRITTSIVRSLAGTMTEPLFKEGTLFQMNSRFLTDINCDLPTLAALADFQLINFPNSGTVQFQGCEITRDGSYDASDTNIIPNLGVGELPCYWKNNNGLPNTYVGGTTLIISEATTVVSVIDDWYALNGNYLGSGLQHFTASADGKLTHTGSSPREFEVTASLAIESGSNDVCQVRLNKWDDSASTMTPLDYTVQTRVINNLQGARNMAYFAMATGIVLDESDYIIIEVRNRTSTSDATAELSSFFRIQER